MGRTTIRMREASVWVVRPSVRARRCYGRSTTKDVAEWFGDVAQEYYLARCPVCTNQGHLKSTGDSGYRAGSDCFVRLVRLQFLRNGSCELRRKTACPSRFRAFRVKTVGCMANQGNESGQSVLDGLHVARATALPVLPP